MTDQVTGPFVLPDDVLIVPVGELSEDVKLKLKPCGDEFAITRPRSRRPSKLVDEHTAHLLAEFRTPKPLVEAIAAYSKARQLDPRLVLQEAFPILQSLVNGQVLVRPGTHDADRIVPSLERGDRFGPFEVVRCVQVLEDTEIFQVQDGEGGVAAIKILRLGWTEISRAMLEREATVLRHLAGDQAPELLDFATFEGLPYLAMKWCSGVSPHVIGGELRDTRAGTRARELLDLCAAIVDAYSRLHERGVMHGDVHPGNILIGRDGELTLVDFGLARLRSADHMAPFPRGVVMDFLEPEAAVARQAHEPTPDPSEAGEQYGVAALLYVLLTGEPHLDLALGSGEALRQIIEDRPLPFSRRGVEPWPDIEAILGRALAKRPEDRFPSMAAFGHALCGVAPPQHAVTAGASLRPATMSRLLDRVLEQLRSPEWTRVNGPDNTPRASLFFGSTGIAYALYRLACIRDDGPLLCYADEWLSRSERGLEEHSCYSASLGVLPEYTGRNALYYMIPGVHLVRALISHAMGDIEAQRESVNAFVTASRPFGRRPDLLAGDAGTLLGSALLLETLLERSEPAAQELIGFGDEVLRNLWEIIDDSEPIGENLRIRSLGIAHGWAGLLYATLRWCVASERPVPGELENRLAQLADMAEPSGRGLRWPVALSSLSEQPVDYFTSWCNGTPGLVHLWTSAHGRFGEDRYLGLAEGCAWNTWEEPNSESADLCCGLGGHAFALLNMYKYTGDRLWLERARVLAGRAAERMTASETRDYLAMSLFAGEAGLAVLAADLTHPEGAAMPVFESEGWPRPAVGPGR